MDVLIFPDSKPNDPGACYELLRQPVAFLLLINCAERRYNQRSFKTHVLHMREFLTKAQDSLISENRKPYPASWAKHTGESEGLI